MSKAREFIAETAKLAAQTEAYRHRAALSFSKKERGELMAEVARLQDHLAIALELKDRKPQPLVVKAHERNAREGTGVLLFSDLHPEEVVTPDKVSGLNEFHPGIAQERVERLVVGARWALDTVRAGYKVREFILAILGDLISNSIHPDLSESNAIGPADAVMLAYDLCVTVIDGMLADQKIERLLIPCCLGNHDRVTPKIRHQTKAETSLATIIYGMLARQYKGDKRVQFDIARGNMVYTNVYGRMVRWTHGDDIRYAGGVGGLTVPMRKAIDSWNRSVDAALTCAGHWHQVTDHSDFVVNGSLIGYTAFAQAIKARFEPAAQAFFVIDKERGKRFFTPIQVQDVDRWS